MERDGVGVSWCRGKTGRAPVGGTDMTVDEFVVDADLAVIDGA